MNAFVVRALVVRERVFLETAPGARSFPVPAGNDLRAEVAVGRNARDRAWPRTQYRNNFDRRSVREGSPSGGGKPTAFGAGKMNAFVVRALVVRECVFLETASGARSFPVQAGNDLRAEVAGGRNARDRA